MILLWYGPPAHKWGQKQHQPTKHRVSSYLKWNRRKIDSNWIVHSRENALFFQTRSADRARQIARQGKLQPRSQGSLLPALGSGEERTLGTRLGKLNETGHRDGTGVYHPIWGHPICWLVLSREVLMAAKGIVWEHRTMSS